MPIKIILPSLAGIRDDKYTVQWHKKITKQNAVDSDRVNG